MFRVMTRKKSDLIASLEAENERDREEMASLRERLEALEHLSSARKNEIARLKISGRTRLGRPTLSRTLFRRVWKEIEDLTWDGRGIPADQIYQVLRSKVDGLRPGTLRVYLHRFSVEEKKLERRGSVWHRTSAEVQRRP